MLKQINYMKKILLYSIFRDECTIYETLSNAIENGNYGFVAYYNENENGFEILEG